MNAPLLQTKLYIPPVRPELVPRPRLIERLDEGLDLGHRLMLVSAPAGFGKTTLLSEWVRWMGDRRGVATRVAWLSLDEGDNDPVRFLAYLAAALGVGEVLHGTPPGRGLGASVDGQGLGASVDGEGFLAGLINQVSAGPGGLVLVLDDYHLITAQPVHDAVSFLLDRLPVNAHVAIATRADPSLPVARLRGRGQLTELRLHDLRFSPKEAAEFLNRVMGLELTAGDVAALESRTEGWVAGLQMAAVALRAALATARDAASFVQDFTGDNRFILDYLIEEVLQHQPAHIQAFLLQTSILDRLCSPLCDAVVEEIGDWRVEIGDSARRSISNLQSPIATSRSQSVLNYLDSSNLFIVPLDSARQWYRYHRLFADLLRGRLQRAHPELVPALHRRASGWYEQSGLMMGAIDHALAAGEMERAADLIEQSAEATLMRGETATFWHWVDTLPDELVRARPGLCALHAWMLLIYGRPLKMVKARLADAERGGELVAGRVTALRGLMAAFRGQMLAAEELSRRALEQLPEEERFVRAFATFVLRSSQVARGEGGGETQDLDDVLQMSLRAGNVMVAVIVASNQAEMYMREGRLRKAAATYRKALNLGIDAQGRRLPVASGPLIGLGELSREWGDLETAARYLVEGIRLAEEWTEVGPFEAYIVLARVRWAQGETDSAWEAMRKAQDLAVKFDLTELDDLSVALLEAQMRVAAGDFAAARRWAEERDLYQYIDTPLEEEAGDSTDVRLRKYELLVLARLLIATERPDAALRLLESLVPIAERRNRPGILIEIQVLQALAHRAQGDVDRALTALGRALALAEPEGYVRIFADEGEPALELLREAVARGIGADTASRVLAASVAPSGAQSVAPGGARVQEGRGVGGQGVPAGQGASTALVEPLTGREMEVLRLLRTHLSSTEIAEELGISANTARFHIKNIYGKLGVHGRSDAVERARELGLLDPSTSSG